MLVNIGLEKSQKFGEAGYLSVDDVLVEVAKHFENFEYMLAQSNTEPTIILKLDGDFEEAKKNFEEMASKLHQEAIALYDENADKGILVGKYAELWGEFNKEYFLTF